MLRNIIKRFRNIFIKHFRIIIYPSPSSEKNVFSKYAYFASLVRYLLKELIEKGTSIEEKNLSSKNNHLRFL